MPNEAFFKLDEEKRNKIVEAMKNEFGSNSFEKSSINKIVEDAGISKGSFWCYFESKEEAINYIIEAYIEKEIEMMISFLKEKDGDIFEAYMELYKSTKFENLQNPRGKLVSNIFKDLIINNEKIIQKFPPESFPKILMSNEEFVSLINFENLNISNKDELASLTKMLNYVLRSNSMDRMLGKVTEEVAYQNYLREMEIIRKGVCKK